MTLFSLTVMLFLIMDPIGNIASWLSMVGKLPAQRQKFILAREMAIAMLTMLIFSFIGDFIFNILQIEETTVKISAGVILFLVAIKILFPNVTSLRANLPEEEPFIIPFAIPLVAGPSLLATIMLFSDLDTGNALMVESIFLASFLAFIVFFFAPKIFKVLGPNGLMALEKLMGMILVMIAIQRFLEGVQQFFVINVH